MSVHERFAALARQWAVTVDEIRTTETSQLGFGTRGDRPVVLKVIRKENNEEWRCGEVLEAFGEPGAVLLPRLVPGHDLVSLCLEGRDDEATEVIASLIERMGSTVTTLVGARSVDQFRPEFAQFRERNEDVIPAEYVDLAEALFGELCTTQRDRRLLHGDLHHFNVLFDSEAGWVVIDPWGAVGEVEFEIGASLRNPAPELLENPRTLQRRLRIYEDRLKLDADRALKWAFATTVLSILWPFEVGVGPDLRGPFSLAARSMHVLLG